MTEAEKAVIDAVMKNDTARNAWRSMNRENSGVSDATWRQALDMWSHAEDALNAAIHALRQERGE